MNTKSSLSPAILAAIALIAICILLFEVYNACLIEVPAKYMAILVHKTGKDLDNSQSIAPSDEYKGVLPVPLTEGRYYYNPFNWAWTVVPQIEIPPGTPGKFGVRVRLYGESLPSGELIAALDSQKGIVPDILFAGRYAINAQLIDPTAKKTLDLSNGRFAEIIELHDPVTIPAGFKGVKTLVSAKLPEKANEVVVPKGVEARGVQTETLEPGTYYFNPYVAKISLVDCRSQRFNLDDIGFSTRDGFWVSLKGVIEFRVNPKDAAKVYVLYGEMSSMGNEGKENPAIDNEIIQKVIVPNARAYTRLKGSSHSGKEFITGDTRASFQEDFQHEMQATCAKEGIEVIQALITDINPPEKIADPVRKRQIAIQQEKQYKKEMAQQLAEQELATQKATVLQKKAEVAAEQEVVVLTVDAKRKQEVALIDAKKRLGVAGKKFEAAKDLATATMAKGKAEADVIRFQNEAQAAGWLKSIEAFSGDGAEFARYTLLKKIAPAFKAMMVNTENSALMDVFKSFKATKTPKTSGDKSNASHPLPESRK
jgi:regulator of protease activity HflC (stomatin/prohibitin superfamily)